MPWFRQGDLVDEGKIINRLLEMKIALSHVVCTLQKYAHTSYKLLRDGDVALVDIRLHTGRTHQIRVHFSHIGSHFWGRFVWRSYDLGITVRHYIAIIAFC